MRRKARSRSLGAGLPHITRLLQGPPTRASRPALRGTLELILNGFEGRIPICIIKCSKSFKYLGVLSVVHYKMVFGCRVFRIVQGESLGNNYHCEVCYESIHQRERLKCQASGSYLEGVAFMSVCIDWCFFQTPAH